MAKKATSKKKRTIKRPTNKERFLSAYREVGTITHAAKLAAVGRKNHYEWLAKDEQYAADFADAQEEAIDLLVAEARRRAFQGTQRKKFHQGEPIFDLETGQQYIENEYSDTLMIFLLKCLSPETFGDRQNINLNGKLGSSVVVYLPDNGRDNTEDAT